MNRKHNGIADSFNEWYDRGYDSGRHEGKLVGMFTANADVEAYLNVQIDKLTNKVNQPGVTPADQVKLMTLYEVRDAVKRGFDNLLQ